MGWWNVLTGRSEPRKPDLDALFAVPSAAVGLQAAAGFRPTGVGTVCFRSGGGPAAVQVETEVRQLLGDDPDVPDDVVFENDSFGYTWLVLRRDQPDAGDTGDPGDTAALCTELHAVNTTLVQQGFDSGLLCTMVPFAGPSGQRFGLVYLYQQGTFYPFAPAPHDPRARDTLLELRVRDLVAGEVPVEQDQQRWLALWDAPGLS
jgi:hypothetical protein